MEDESIRFEDVVEVIKKVKPEWNESHLVSERHRCGGEGFVSASIFTFFKYQYLWIVFLREPPYVFAYKVIYPEWIQAYSRLITSSPIIFVEYDKSHRICGWSAAQEKTPPFNGGKSSH